MNLRHLLLAGGLFASAWLVLFGDNTAESSISEPVVRSGSVAVDTVEPAFQGGPTAVILALKPREELIGAAGASRGGLFSSQSWTPPPPPPEPPPPPPLPTQSAPQLPFTYLGKKMEDEQWEVFLSRNDQTLIVRPEAIIAGTYRVESIKPPVMSVTYLPLNQVQTLNIGAAQ